MPKFGQLPPQVRRLFVAAGWKNCNWCGAWFQSSRTQHVFCTAACRQANWVHGQRKS